jgi:hypothetical protein
MDGLKLARAIRDCWPLIELILTSGHFDVPEGDIPERGLFFSKPYRDEPYLPYEICLPLIGLPQIPLSRSGESA